MSEVPKVSKFYTVADILGENIRVLENGDTEINFDVGTSDSLCAVVTINLIQTDDECDDGRPVLAFKLSVHNHNSQSPAECAHAVNVAIEHFYSREYHTKFGTIA